MDLNEVRARLQKRAIGMKIGGFRPPSDPMTSWFGKVCVALPGEEWPMGDDGPMHPICQLNLRELPYRPRRLEDVELITLFVGSIELIDNSPNGQNWCLRAYRDTGELVEIEQMPGFSGKAFPMRPRIIEVDYPCYEDIPIELSDELNNDYHDLFPNQSGFKLGGWPTLVQAEIYWAPFNQHPAEPEYVFQVDSIDKGLWEWGDGGVAYIGRGTAEGHTDTWTFEWQCM